MCHIVFVDELLKKKALYILPVAQRLFEYLLYLVVKQK